MTTLQWSLCCCHNLRGCLYSITKSTMKSVQVYVCRSNRPVIESRRIFSSFSNRSMTCVSSRRGTRFSGRARSIYLIGSKAGDLSLSFPRFSSVDESLKEVIDRQMSVKNFLRCSSNLASLRRDNRNLRLMWRFHCAAQISAAMAAVELSNNWNAKEKRTPGTSCVLPGTTRLAGRL